MKAARRNILRNRPHLSDSLRVFYEREAAFINATARLPLGVMPAQTAYAPELLEEIFDNFSSLLEWPAGTLTPLKWRAAVLEARWPSFGMGLPTETPSQFLSTRNAPMPSCRFSGSMVAKLPCNRPRRHW